jgi:RHS repeat-associated protein
LTYPTRLGRRIGKIVDADGTSPQTTYFLYDGDRVIEERDAAGGVTAGYVYGVGLDEVVSVTRGGTTHFFHQDDQCNTTAVTNAAGQVVEWCEYGDFGTPVFFAPDQTQLSVSAIQNTRLFNGREYDAETGLYYYRTRYLDPRTGRFTTRDTIGIWGDPANLGNGYAYVGNNPWTFVDPFGMEQDELDRQLQQAHSQGAIRASRSGGHVDGIADEEWARAVQQTEQEATEVLANFGGGALKAADRIGIAIDLYTLGAGTVAHIAERSVMRALAREAGEEAAKNPGRAVRFGRWLKGLVCRSKLPGEALENASFAQTTFREAFSKEGKEELSKIIGRNIKTIDDLADAIRTGHVDPSKIPVNYIVRDGNTLILNTRTSEALRRAGIPRSRWNAVNVTGDEMFEDCLNKQLARNQLTTKGFANPVPK